MFQITELSLGNGLLGISPLPGRDGRYDADLIAVFQWNPSLVITMTTTQEMDMKGAAGLGTDLTTAGVNWVHWPVPNFGVPTQAGSAQWTDISKRAHRSLDGGGRVLMHCQVGCGRSGMALLRMMAEAGEAPEAALKRLRNVRPCAVETDDQFRWAAEGFANG